MSTYVAILKLMKLCDICHFIFFSNVFLKCLPLCEVYFVFSFQASWGMSHFTKLKKKNSNSRLPEMMQQVLVRSQSAVHFFLYVHHRTWVKIVKEKFMWQCSYIHLAFWMQLLWLWKPELMRCTFLQAPQNKNRLWDYEVLRRWCSFAVSVISISSLDDIVSKMGGSTCNRCASFLHTSILWSAASSLNKNKCYLNNNKNYVEKWQRSAHDQHNLMGQLQEFTWWPWRHACLMQPCIILLSFQIPYHSNDTHSWKVQTTITQDRTSCTIIILTVYHLKVYWMDWKRHTPSRRPPMIRDALQASTAVFAAR